MLHRLERVPEDMYAYEVEELGEVKEHPKVSAATVTVMLLLGAACVATSYPACLPCRFCVNGACQVDSPARPLEFRWRPERDHAAWEEVREGNRTEADGQLPLLGQVVECFVNQRASGDTYHFDSQANKEHWADQCPARFATAVVALAVWILYALKACMRRNETTRFPKCDLAIGILAASLGLAIAIFSSV